MTEISRFGRLRTGASSPTAGVFPSRTTTRSGATITQFLKPAAPLSPDAVVDDFAALLKSYRVSRVTGDRYAGEFPRELFRKHGIAYDLAKQTKSELFRDLLPLLNSGRIVLPRNDRLQGQIVGLERRTSAVGRDTISHPDRGHDDVANAVAGAAALSKFGGYDTSLRWVSGDDDDWTANTLGFL